MTLNRTYCHSDENLAVSRAQGSTAEGPPCFEEAMRSNRRTETDPKSLQMISIFLERPGQQNCSIVVSIPPGPLSKAP